MSTLHATLSRRLLHPEGSRLIYASWCSPSRLVLVEQQAEGPLSVCRLVDGERGPALLTDDEMCGVGVAYDQVTDRIVVALNGLPHVFDGTTGAQLGVLAAHPRPTYSVEIAPGGRVVTNCTDGWRRLWDLKTLALLTQRHLRWYKGWSAPVGLLPGDPMLSCLTSMRSGRWVSALVNAHTGRDVGRHRWPARQPAHHTAIPRPGALEWVGVLCEGSEGEWGPSRVVHFVSGEARVIDEEPLSDSLPGVVSLEFLTEDWLFTSGCRRPHIALNLRTGARRACPLEGPTHPSGLMLCRREIAVFDLNTGALAPLYPGEAPEEGSHVQSLSADGATALVSTPEALEWWAITR